MFSTYMLSATKNSKNSIEKPYEKIITRWFFFLYLIQNVFLDDLILLCFFSIKKKKKKHIYINTYIFIYIYKLIYLPIRQCKLVETELI